MPSHKISINSGGTKEFSEDNIASFGSGLRGELITPESPNYDEARSVWNGMIDKRPALIARCKGVADVSLAVQFAKEHDLVLAVRGGGHNVAGNAICDGGLVIDLSRMNAVTVRPDKRTVKVQGGATLGDIDHETHHFGLGVPMGVVSETGIAGLTLHGGYGWLSRKHGLALDNVISFDIVTAEGELLRASEMENKDLYWALKGGGGNFGIVTGFEFKLHPVGPEVWVAMVFHPFEKAKEGVRFFHEFIMKSPEEMFGISVLWTVPDEPPFPESYRGKPAIAFLACYHGPFEKGEEAIRPLREFASPIADMSGPVKFVDLQKMLDEEYPSGRFYYWKSLYLNQLTEEIIDILVNFSTTRPSPLTSIDVWPLGGAVARVAPDATAFTMRYASCMIGIESNWTDRERADENIAWTRELNKALEPFAKKGIYLNFPGFAEEGEDLIKGTYENNYERLKKIKAKYDPTNLFHGNFNIKP